jgi:hypothetical protein
VERCGIYLGICGAVAGKDDDGVFTCLVRGLRRKIDRESSLSQLLRCFHWIGFRGEPIAATTGLPMRLRSSVGRRSSGEHCLVCSELRDVSIVSVPGVVSDRYGT